MSKNQVEKYISYHIKTRQNLQCFRSLQNPIPSFPCPSNGEVLLVQL